MNWRYAIIPAALAAGMLLPPLSVSAEEETVPAGTSAVTDTTEPETTVTEPATEPETTVTDATEPATTVTDATEPETTEPATTEAVTTEPETTEPAVPAETVPGIRTDAEGRAYCVDVNTGEILTGRIAFQPSEPIGDIDGSGNIDATDAAALLEACAQAGATGQDAAELLLAANAGRCGNAAAMRQICDANYDSGLGADDAAEILIYAAALGAGDAVQPLGEFTVFADENGYLERGFFTDPTSGKTAYADEQYHLRQGLVTIAGRRYYLDDESCVYDCGWVTVGGVSYYVAEGGYILQNTWFPRGDDRLYLSADGAPLTGLQVLDGESYYFDENGIMLTGWVEIDGKSHYFGTDGIMYKLWHEIDGATYCFGGGDGVMLTRWADIGGERYYFGTDGKLRTGWQEIGGKRYYFTEEGKLLRDQAFGEFWLESDGRAVSMTYHTNRERAQAAFAEYGTSIDGLYKYVRVTTRYKKIEATKTLAQIEDKGWLYYVDYAMTHRYGVCYYLAAKMDFLLQEAGYECRMVHSTHGSGDHYWNQVNIDGTWVNYDLTNGLYAKTWEQMVAYGSYIFLGYVTPEYT